jgi:transcriptional regulator with XRE-family HTH domain
VRQLVASWLQAKREYHGNTQAQALRELNDALGLRIRASRVAEWRRGVYTPSIEVVSEMLYRAMPWLLEQAAIVASLDQLSALDRLLWVHEEKRGKVLRYRV